MNVSMRMGHKNSKKKILIVEVYFETQMKIKKTANNKIYNSTLQIFLNPNQSIVRINNNVGRMKSEFLFHSLTFKIYKMK